MSYASSSNCLAVWNAESRQFSILQEASNKKDFSCFLFSKKRQLVGALSSSQAGMAPYLAWWSPKIRVCVYDPPIYYISSQKAPPKWCPKFFKAHMCKEAEPFSWNLNIGIYKDYMAMEKKMETTMMDYLGVI